MLLYRCSSKCAPVSDQQPLLKSRPVVQPSVQREGKLRDMLGAYLGHSFLAALSCTVRASSALAQYHVRLLRKIHVRTVL